MHIIHCLPFTFPGISVHSLISQRHLVSCCMIACFVLKKYAVPIGHGNSFCWSWKSHGKSLLKKSGHPGYKRWWKQSRHRFLPWIMLNSMRGSVLCSPLVLLIANYPQRDGQVEVTSCWLRARMSYMPADGYPSYLTNRHRQLQQSETRCNKSWGSVEVLWRCRGIFDYYLFLQIYGGVCSHRILNIGQHLTKLWIRKLIVSGSLCQEHCNTERYWKYSAATVANSSTYW